MTVRRTWRVSRFGRVVCVLLALLYVGLAVSVLSIAGDVTDDGVRFDLSDGLFLASVFLILAFGHVWVSQRCRLLLTDQSVVVVNAVRTRVLPLVEIVEVTPGDGGLEIESRTLDTVRAFAVQTSKVSGWPRLPSRAEDISDEIRLAAAAGVALRSGPRHKHHRKGEASTSSRSMAGRTPCAREWRGCSRVVSRDRR